MRVTNAAKHVFHWRGSSCKKMTLSQVTSNWLIWSRNEPKQEILRSVLIPEGSIEFIPELGILIQEINDILSTSVMHPTV